MRLSVGGNARILDPEGMLKAVSGILADCDGGKEPYPASSGEDIATMRAVLPKLAYTVAGLLNRTVASGQFESYADYLCSAEWQIRREWAKALAHYRCELCNGADGLQVHHRTYERIYRELPGDLTVLCGDCHAKHHGKLDG